MFSTTTEFASLCVLGALLMPVSGISQTRVAGATTGRIGVAVNSVNDEWTAKFTPGTSTQYEFEAIVQVSSEHAQNVKFQAPENCSYRLKAVLKLDFARSTSDGTVSGQVSFRGVDADLPDCVSSIRARVRRALRTFGASGTEFQLYPGGDVHFSRPIASDEPELVSLLRKAAWDLLQQRVTDGGSAPGSPWASSRRFLYWPDTFVEDMQVAASTTRYARDVQIGNGNYSLFEYKQVFSPLDIPAYVESRSRANDFMGTTFVTGSGGVSLLWDKTENRAVYLHRQRAIDNRLMLQYDNTAEARHLASFAIEEESTLRWLPASDTEIWLGNLHKFENAAGESAAKVASKASANRLAEQKEISDIVDRLPQGYERWNRQICTGPYCFELSLAVPEASHVVDESSMTVLLVGTHGNRSVMVAIGPLLDLQSSGLTGEELLQQQSLRFVNNHLWFGRGTGELKSFLSESVHDRPAGASEFTSRSRQLTAIRGRLVMVIGPYDRLVPVACAHDEAESDLETVCATVTESLRLR